MEKSQQNPRRKTITKLLDVLIAFSEQAALDPTDLVAALLRDEAKEQIIKFALSNHETD